MPAGSILASRFGPSSLRWRWARRRSGLPSTARIFGIGLSRTGTSSLTEAFTLLGYRSLHFPEDHRTREEVMAFLATDGDRLRLSVLERLDAVTDTPICATFEALDAAYPGSRFVLTTRERQSWLESCRHFWAVWVEPYLLEHPRNPGAAYIRAICDKLYRGPSFDPERFSRAYDEYHERVRHHFRDRSADLLTIDICAGQGWAPLCEFLDLSLPRAQFPWDARLRATGDDQRVGPVSAS